VDEANEVDELVAQLRDRVEKRRRSGQYPADLEEEMTAHFRRILHQRRGPRVLPDVEGPIRAARGALPLEAKQIPATSAVPGGELLHKTVARIVSRQTQGALQTVEAFARPVQAALEALLGAVQELDRTIQVDVAHSLDALYERQAAQERLLTASGIADRRVRGREFQPWFSAERFEEAFRGSRAEMLDRYRDLAARLVGAAPVLDIGCGRGEFLELLAEAGVDARGVDTDPELVKSAVENGVDAVEVEAIRYLSDLPDQELGGIVLIQVIEHFSAQEIVDFVALATDKVRPGGRVFIETVNPQSLYVFAHAMFLDPTHWRPVHPAYLEFLFREAGFSEVSIEWRSPPPASDVLEETPADSQAAPLYNANVRRLNQLLFAPQDYLAVAIR
jgi:2-polyprenyl-3-methyl-5-hydroxy-6-metoxy-1,4-benzoquinol methylase